MTFSNVSFGEQEKRKSSNTLPVLGFIGGGAYSVIKNKGLHVSTMPKLEGLDKDTFVNATKDLTGEDKENAQIITDYLEKQKAASTSAAEGVSATPVAVDPEQAKTVLGGTVKESAEATAGAKATKAAEGTKGEIPEAITKAYKDLNGKLPKKFNLGGLLGALGIGLVAGYVLKWIFGGKSEE